MVVIHEIVRSVLITLITGCLRGTGVEGRSVTGKLSLSYARPAADG